MLDKMPKFDVKIYRGDNAISLSNSDSGILTSISSTSKMHPSLIVANTKQLIAYHMIRMISDSFKYIDKDIYGIVNEYIYNLPLGDFLNNPGGDEALKLNIMAEVYKLTELLNYYQKPIQVDIKIVQSEVDALVNKIFDKIK